MNVRTLLLLAAPLILSGATTAPSTAPATAPSAAPSRSVWDGVYSPEQLDRGKKAYNTSCARCHGETFLGNDDAPPLVGKDFLAKWNGKSVGSLVELTRKQMPTDGPGKLSRKQCTDMVAYLLNANDFPVGTSEMVPEVEALDGIFIQEKK